MPALLRYTQPIDREIFDPTFKEVELCFLNKMRMISMRCRSSARLDMFEACRLLGHMAETNEDVVIEALLRTLRQGLGQSPKFLTPNSDELTFDENWLMRCICALNTSDHASFKFLIYRRVSAPYRQSLGFLIKKVSEYLTET